MGTQHRLLFSTLLETSVVGVDILSLSQPLGLVSKLLSPSHPLLAEGGPGTPQQTDFEVLTWAHLEAGRTSQWASSALPAPPPPWMQFQGPGKNSSTIPETRPGLHSLHV